LFVDQPDDVIAGAIKAGATGGDIQNHDVPGGRIGREDLSIHSDTNGWWEISLL